MVSAGFSRSTRERERERWNPTDVRRGTIESSGAQPGSHSMGHLNHKTSSISGIPVGCSQLQKFRYILGGMIVRLGRTNSISRAADQTLIRSPDVSFRRSKEPRNLCYLHACDRKFENLSTRFQFLNR